MLVELRPDLLPLVGPLAMVVCVLVLGPRGLSLELEGAWWQLSAPVASTLRPWRIRSPQEGPKWQSHLPGPTCPPNCLQGGQDGPCAHAQPTGAPVGPDYPMKLP